MKRFARVTEAVLYAIALTAILAMVGGWWLMIAVGVAHHEWASTIPSIGYWSAVKITVLWAIGVGGGRARTRFSQ